MVGPRDIREIRTDSLEDMGVPAPTDEVLIRDVTDGVVKIANVSDVGITDHGGLSGLLDDDHTNYLNSARHDSEDHSTAMGTVVIGDISDVAIAAPASPDFLAWNGSAWVNREIAASDVTSGTFANARISQASVTQHEAALTITESQISNLTHYTSTDFDTDFAAKSTTNLSEGTNLYYTDARVTAHVDKAFVDALNVDADTLDGSHLIDIEKYVQSRLENLVTNGNGYLEDNTNFTGMVYEPTEKYTGGGSFKVTSGSTTKRTDELIPIDVSRRYKYSYAIKLLDDGGSTADIHHYGLTEEFDADNLAIAAYDVLNVNGSRLTTLAAPLNPGDTTITLTDATGWFNGATGHMRNINFYPYTSASGYQYPDYTYSRLNTNRMGANSAGAWLENGITGNVITLNTAIFPSGWTGPAYASGTAVANSQSGGSYSYIAGGNEVTTPTWTVYSGSQGPYKGSNFYPLPAAGELVGDSGAASGNLSAPGGFRWGTSQVKVGWLLNRDSNAGSPTTAVDSIVWQLDVGANINVGDIADVTISTPADNEVMAYDSGSGDWLNQTHAEAGISSVGHVHDTSDITTGTFADARISESSVTQHQAALSITESQISNLDHLTLEEVQDNLGTLFIVGGTDITVVYDDVANTLTFNKDALVAADIPSLDTSKITTGTFADARIAQSNVTQHQAALSITESQISDFGTYMPTSGGTFTGPVVFPDGTETAPDIRFAGSATSGFSYISDIGDASTAGVAIIEGGRKIAYFGDVGDETRIYLGGEFNDWWAYDYVAEVGKFVSANTETLTYSNAAVTLPIQTNATGGMSVTGDSNGRNNAQLELTEGSAGSVNISMTDEGLWEYWLHMNGDSLYVLSNMGNGNTTWTTPYPIQMDGSIPRVDFDWQTLFTDFVDINANADISGTLAVGSAVTAGRFRASAATSAADVAFRPSTDTDTGMYASAGALIEFSVAGTREVYINANGLYGTALRSTGGSVIATNITSAGNVLATSGYMEANNFLIDGNNGKFRGDGDLAGLEIIRSGSTDVARLFANDYIDFRSDGGVLWAGARGGMTSIYGGGQDALFLSGSQAIISWNASSTAPGDYISYNESNDDFDFVVNGATSNGDIWAGGFQLGSDEVLKAEAVDIKSDPKTPNDVRHAMRQHLTPMSYVPQPAPGSKDMNRMPKTINGRKVTTGTAQQWKAAMGQNWEGVTERHGYLNLDMAAVDAALLQYCHDLSDALDEALARIAALESA